MLRLYALCLLVIGLVAFSLDLSHHHYISINDASRLYFDTLLDSQSAKNGTARDASAQ